MRDLSIKKDNQDGFASIVIALVLILILALLTVGFAQLARREQQTALDKQLANQAYYAAESGVNDAIKDIRNNIICDPTLPGITCPPGSVAPSATTCMTPPPPTATYGTQNLPPTAKTASPVINSAGQVKYTCLLVNQQPKSVDFTDITPQDGQYLEFSATQPINTLTVNWWSFDNHKDFQTSHTSKGPFLPQGSGAGKWGNSPPLLLVSLTAVPNTGSVTRTALINNTFNANLYPSNESAGFTTTGTPVYSTNVNWDLTKQGIVVPGNCGHNVDPTQSDVCSVTFNNLGLTNYVLHITSYYDDANVHVTGTDSSNNPIHFVGQDEIDVTAQAHNVLKRIRVRLNADGTNGTILNPSVQPNDALAGQNICKRLSALPQSEGGTSFINPDGSPPTAASPACDLDQ